MDFNSSQIQKLKNEIADLKIIIHLKETEIRLLEEDEELAQKTQQSSKNISKRDVERYSRQIIIPQVGVDGQCKLKQLSVLVVGVGGLGCPAALYLAGAGIGRIGLVDYDVVEESNLHRQLLHNEDQLGKPKVSSAAVALKRINGELQVDEYKLQLSSGNAADIVKQYDIIVDASDNVATRYLVNDASVLAGRTLVSGSALQMEGQLTVYNHSGGPCYRCLYPEPPPPDTVTNCSDAGVLGAVPGVIGTLQALEVVKIALGMEGVLSSKLLLFDGESSCFRTINLRKKNENCSVCGLKPTITELIDYEQFCGSAADDKDHHLTLLKDGQRIAPEQLKFHLDRGLPLVIDVRPEIEFQMCAIPHSINIPLLKLLNNVSDVQKAVEKAEYESPHPLIVCMVCRRGNDSQRAVTKIASHLPKEVQLVDLRGGLHAWARNVDPTFPIY